MTIAEIQANMAAQENLDKTIAAYKILREQTENERDAKISEWKTAHTSGLISAAFLETETEKIKVAYEQKLDDIKLAEKTAVKEASRIPTVSQGGQVNADGTIPSTTLFPNIAPAIAPAIVDSGYGKYALLALAAGAGLFFWWRRRKKS